MKDVIKISTVAFNATWGDKQVNLNRMLGYVDAAAAEGANLIVFPEMGLTGYDDEEEDKPQSEKMQTKLAETVPGPSSEAMAQKAKELGVYIAFGLPERDKDDASVYTTRRAFVVRRGSSAHTTRFTCRSPNRIGRHEGTSRSSLRRRGALSVWASAMTPTVSKS